MTVITISSVAVTIGMVGIYAWGFNRIRDIRTETATLEVQTKTIQLQNKARENLRRTVRETYQQQRELVSAQVSEYTIVSFMNAIEALGKNTGADVSVQSVKHITAKDNGINKNSFSIIVKAEGSFQSLYKTLSLLEVFPQPVTIQNVHITQAPTKKYKERWEGVFTLSIRSIETVQ